MLHSRIKRVEEEYRHAMAEILNYEIDDPRVEFASVSYVHISKDLSNAMVGISLLQDDPEQAREAMDAIESARGYIKCQLARRIRLKRLPDPHFKLDTGLKEAFELYEVMEEVRQNDPPIDLDEEE